jgi:hypothetical protein
MIILKWPKNSILEFHLPTPYNPSPKQKVILAGLLCPKTGINFTPSGVWVVWPVFVCSKQESSCHIMKDKR